MTTERRAGPTDKISDLIEKEDDPKSRALLVVLQNINLSLIANTSTVNKIEEQLELHLAEFRSHTSAEEALINKGKGMWPIINWVICSIQAISIWLMLTAYSDLASLHKFDNELATRVTVLEKAK